MPHHLLRHLLLLTVIADFCSPMGRAQGQRNAKDPDVGQNEANENTVEAPIPIMRFERIGVEDGLPSSEVGAIAQDSAGFLWIGTGLGLARYDGYEFRVYKPDRKNSRSSISDAYVTALYDDGNYLWV